MMKRIRFLPFYVLSLLPFWCLYLLSDLASALLLYVIRYRRKVVRRNLRRSFPNIDRPTLHRIERKFYRHFCDVFVESLKGLTISRRAAVQRLQVKNTKLIEQYHAEQKSVLLYTGHQGNWEWFSWLPLFVPHQVTSFYQPLSNAYFDQLMYRIRSRFGMDCVASQRGYRALMEWERKGVPTLNVMIGDQRPRKGSRMEWVPFLERSTPFLGGADQIARRARQVVVFSYFEKPKRGHYILHFIPLAENLEETSSAELIGHYADYLEKAIQKNPEMWLWSHKRWKQIKPRNGKRE